VPRVISNLLQQTRTPTECKKAQPVNTRVARWYIFKPKIQIWVNFLEGHAGEDVWSISRPLVVFYGHSVPFMIIWYIFPRFGILFQDKSGNPGQHPKRQKNGANSTSPFKDRGTIFLQRNWRKNIGDFDS
jgi:hypothetical protein